MSDSRWDKIVSIFEEAVELPVKERADYLQRVCGDDVELRSEVESMIKADNDAEDFIESPILAASSLSIFDKLNSKKRSEDEPEDMVGKRVGAFRLTRELGRGGMGAVYLAERADGEFTQFVAIKLIKRGMDSDFIIKRFRHERQILANLEHQNIARLFDGGTTADGLPFLVMEFIEGESLYHFCDSKKMSVRERLAIFLQICSAVSYAHDNQIIHRDIKPNNILVTKSEVPKLLDFGIAKILDPDLIHESVSPTASMMRLLTPDYASPEQIRGEEVTSASDIYSLGMLLYELLTGHRPFNFAKLSLHEVSRIVCEETPTAPSKIISNRENALSMYRTGNANFRDFLAVRKTDLQKLRSDLSESLDNIILRSLAKDPEDRYPTVLKMCEDIDAYLSGEFIEAAPRAKRARSAAKTRSYSTETGDSQSLAVLPFKQLNLFNDEDTGEKFLGIGLADAITTRLSKIKRFVVRPTSSVMRFEDVLADPIRVGEELGVEYILDGHLKRANDRLRITVQLLNVSKNATVWATSIDETFGDIFKLEDTISTKVTEALLPHLSETELEEFSRRGTENAEAFEHYLRGRFHFNSFTEDGFAKAIVSFHRAVAEDPNYAHAYSGIADYYNWLGIFGVLPPRECFDAALDAATRAVELDSRLAEAHTSLGFSLHAGKFDYAGAEQHFLRSLELNPNYVTNYTWLAILRFTENRFEDGLHFAKRAIELDPFSSFNQHNFAWGLYYAHRFDESIEQYRRLLDESPQYGLGHYAISKVFRIQGKFDDALAAIETADQILNDSVFVKLAKAECFAAAGRTGEALQLLDELNELAKERYVSPYQLSLVYCYLEKHEEAIERLEQALKVREPWLNWMAVEPVFDKLRRNRRFQILNNNFNAMILRSSSVSSDPEISTALVERGGTIADSSFQDRETLVLNADGNSNDNPLAKPVRKKAAFASVGAGLILVAVLYFANVLSFPFGSRMQPPAASARSLTVVVMPFEVHDQNVDKSVGTGIAESLSSKLGTLKKLTVISASSAKEIEDLPIPEIGKTLGVGYIVRGSINSPGSFAAEFVNASDGSIIWREEFPDDRDLLDAQRKIAEKIWQTLEFEPSPAELRQISKVYTNDRRAYELYLLGRFQMTNRSPESLKRSIITFSEAASLDPNFALAYAGLADAYALLNLYEIPSSPDAYDKAIANARRALSLDESLAEAHASLAYVKFYKERDRAGAELEFRRAIQINPSYATAHHWFALALAAMNNAPESISEAKTAQFLDPVSPSIKAASAMTLFYAGQFDEALRETEAALKINSTFVPAYKVRRWIFQVSGNYDAAIDSFLRERSLSGGGDIPGWFVTQAQVEALGPRRAQILSELTKAIEDESVKSNPQAYSYEIALAFAALGEKQKALEWLETAEKTRNHSFNFIETDPRLVSLRSDPRFSALVAKLNRPSGTK
ncbi:MAG: protein kinase [Pyrinomonadaceae bacterium]|nr:protein kinase [Pyrinomonadaceae bacterium]